MQTTALNPAFTMSACGKPTKSDAASALAASKSMHRACSERFGSACEPWRITCGNIGRLPQAITGFT